MLHTQELFAAIHAHVQTIRWLATEKIIQREPDKSLKSIFERQLGTRQILKRIFFRLDRFRKKVCKKNKSCFGSFYSVKAKYFFSFFNLLLKA